MQDILIRIETQDYEAWLATHYDHVEDRRAHGIADGPVYRNIDNPNAALFHIRVESMERAMEWFGSEKFREGPNAPRSPGASSSLPTGASRPRLPNTAETVPHPPD